MTEMPEMPDMPLFSQRRRPAQMWSLFGPVLTAMGTMAVGTWLWTAPAFAQYADQTDLSDRLVRLESQVMMLQQQLDRGAGSVQSPGGPPVAPTQAADFEVRLAQLERTVQQMVGKYEEAGFEVTQLRERLDKMSTDLEYRFSQLDAKGGNATATKPPETPTPPAATAKPAPSPVPGGIVRQARRPTGGADAGPDAPDPCGHDHRSGSGRRPGQRPGTV